jgi:ankyrin repeat protein
MDRIRGQKHGFRKLAEQALAWITYATRPLTTSELRHALAVQIGRSELDKQNIPQLQRIISTCLGLLTVDEESNIVRLVHYTTQEYFEKTREAWFPNAEIDITTVCITYLSFSTFESGLCHTYADFKERLRSNEFYDYAVCNWGLHAHTLFTENEQRTTDLADNITEVSSFTAQPIGHHSRKTLKDLACLILDFLKSRTKVSASSQVLLTSGDNRWDGRQLPMKVIGTHLASCFGLREAMTSLLESGYDPDSKDDYRGQTPLMWAAQKGHEAVVRPLLADHRVNANSRDDAGQTALMLAAQNRHEAVVRLLLADHRVDADSRDNSGQTALMLASQSGHEAVVRLLLADHRVDADSRDNDFRRTALIWAAESGHEAVVRLLLADHRVDVDSRDNIFEQTALMLAAESGHEAVVRLLLADHRVDADSRDNSGWTALMLASQSGHEAVVRLLLADHRVDADSRDNSGQTALMLAAESGHEAVVKLLLADHRVDVDSRDNIFGQIALMLAAQRGHEAVVRLLLADHRVDADSRDNIFGQTALMLAAESGHEAVVRLLLADHRVDADSRDNDFRRTALMWAAESGHEAVVRLLQSYIPR